MKLATHLGPAEKGMNAYDDRLEMFSRVNRSGSNFCGCKEKILIRREISYCGFEIII